ncbi:MAG: hypothetical protein IPJ76_13365 [Flavobacteriales bacterium]|nr:MAG: hypothetical protein IPJ76_13365 [Flavobacteriales bacterium]
MAIASVVLIIRLFCKGALDAPTAAERHALITARIRPVDGVSCVTYGTGTMYYIACTLEQPRDMAPGDGVRMSAALGDADVVVAAFDTSGNYRWHRTLGSTGNDRMVNTIANTGKLYVHCSFAAAPVIAHGSHSVPLPVPAAESIATFDSTGALLWIRTVQDLKADTTARWPFPPFQ